MANVDDSNKLICALSFINDKHFVQHAFKLSCNHYVCKKCLEAFSSRYTDIFRCVICGQVLNNECVTKCESKEANEQLEKAYPGILKAHVKESNEKINYIENELNEKQERIEATIDFVSFDLELRAESIRMDIGSALNDFNEKLKNARENFLKRDLVVKDTENATCISTTGKNKIKNKEYLYECQNQEKEIDRLTKLYKNFEIDATFLCSKNVLDAKLFGNLQLSSILNDVIMRIEHRNIKYHNTGLYKSDIREMCVIKNKGIVTLSYDKNQVALFEDLGEEYRDYEMTGLKKTDEYNGFGRPDFYIHPRSVAYCQKNDKFYITDLSDNGRILMTDGRLRSINKTFNCSRDKFFGLESVSCNDTYVYVSVVGTGKVEVFSLDLNRNVDSFELGYRPERITVSNSTLCVSTSEKIYFYDIKTKALKSYHKMNFGTVSYISPFFFVYNYKKIYCYDEDGDLVHEIDAERLFNQFDPYDGCMGFYRDSLIISQNSEQRLIELTLDM